MKFFNFITWDARTRPQGRRTHVRAASDRVVPRGKSRIGPMQLKSAPTKPKSGRLGPYRPKRPSQAEIQIKKKKKRCKRTVLLTLKHPDPSHFVQPLSLRPSSPFSVCSVPHLSSLCFGLFVSAVCCFSLQVCSLCSFLELLFFVFYNFSLSNCLEKYL